MMTRVLKMPADFSGPSGTVQKIDITFVGQIINHRGLIYINETTFDDTFETLHTNRKLHVINE